MSAPCRFCHRPSWGIAALGFCRRVFCRRGCFVANPSVLANLLK